MKRVSPDVPRAERKSRPPWARELKQLVRAEHDAIAGRAPRGRVN